MADELWHYGHTGAIIALASWAFKVAFSAGKAIESQRSLSKRVSELRDDVVGRLERIETLLMERK